MNRQIVDSGSAGPHVLISAGVHGDEYEPILAALALKSRLQGGLVRGKVTIVPVVNFSAFQRGSRYGDDGLDLARICPGDPEGSSSQVAASQISQLIQESDYYIDLHTGGKLLQIYPLVGYMLHSSEEVLRSQRQMATAFNLPVVWGTDALQEGRTLSVARDAGVPAVYVEYGGGGVADERIVEAYVTGCMNVLAWRDMLKDAPEVQPVRQMVVEDPTPDAGHLQSKMPSPADGIFTASVRPGDNVRRGEKWGNVVEVPGGKVYDVHADKDGIALFQRALAQVNKGDALGGILQVIDNEKVRS